MIGLMIKSNLWSQTVTRLMIKEKKFLVQLSTFNKKKIDQVLLSLTHNDHLSMNEFGYQMIKEPGAIYKRYLVDIHKKISNEL
jgi:hypothetical protein